jgi:hypothetical protein
MDDATGRATWARRGDEFAAAVKNGPLPATRFHSD